MAERCTRERNRTRFELDMVVAVICDTDGRGREWYLREVVLAKDEEARSRKALGAGVEG